MEIVSKWQMASGTWRVPDSSVFNFLILLLLCSAAKVGTVWAQEQPNAAADAVDSIHVDAHYMDSLLTADSISQALRLEDELRFEKTHQLATQRLIDLTGDGKPEVLRLEGYVPSNIDDTRLYFTIKDGRKTLFEDSWLAKGYFDTIDHLTPSRKLTLLRRIITIFFANENFEIVDSNDFNDMMKHVDVADIVPGSAYARTIFDQPRAMYSVFRSRNYWYGLIWDPRKEKFIKAWRN